MMSSDQMLVETAMHTRKYAWVESMLPTLPPEVLEHPTFLERYKAFALAKWAEHDAWHTDEPHLVLSALHEFELARGGPKHVMTAAAYVCSAGRGKEAPSLPQPLTPAQILSTQVNEQTTVRAFNALVKRTFPDHEDYANDKQKVRGSVPCAGASHSPPSVVYGPGG